MRRRSRISSKRYCVLFFLWSWFLGRDTLAQEKLPNIVLILADDMGYGDVGCYNPDSKIPTPNLDRLAREGVRFTDAHSPSALCSPTRYALMTGRYCWRTALKRGVLNEGPLLIEKDRLTLPAILRQRGYATGCVGKWHLGLGTARENWDSQQDWEPGPGQAGFDYSFILPNVNSESPHCFVEKGRLVSPLKPAREALRVYQREKSIRVCEGWRDEEAGPTLTRKAIEFLERQAKVAPQQPFFLYFPTIAAHVPSTPAPFMRGKSQAGPRGDHVAEFDWSVGEVLSALDRLNLTGNTLLVVTSDNGGRPFDEEGNTYGHRSCGNLRGAKGDIWEGGHRVPFLAKWPGRTKAGATSTQLLDLADMMATFAAVVGFELPNNAGEDSYNMLPALLEPSDAEIRPHIIHHSGQGFLAIRKGLWKLIPMANTPGISVVYSSSKNTQTLADRKREPGFPIGELYNLGEDPGESNNLYNQHPDRVYELLRLLEECRISDRSRPSS
ncbi:MAG: sulfatase-like hydrolase/transferase [Acidobacteriota bacterium]